MAKKLDDVMAVLPRKRRQRIQARAKELIALNGFVQTTKILTIGRDQAVRIPPEYRFHEKEIYIRRDTVTGDVILSRRPLYCEDFFALDATTEVPADFMNEAERKQFGNPRGFFEGVNQSDSILEKSKKP